MYRAGKNYFRVEALPEGWGLLYYIEGKNKKVHGWPPNTLWDTGSPFAGRTNVNAERDIMYSALRRLVIHGHFKDLYNGLYGRCGLCDRILKENFEEHSEHGRICKKSCP